MQREAKRGIGRSKISGEQIRRLKELGVWWDKPDDYLNIQFQKKSGGSHKISGTRIQRSKDFAVCLDQPDTWEMYFSALEQYKNGEGNGDPNCPQSYLKKDTSPPLKLGKWLGRQRQAKRGSKGRNISAEQIRRLEELGVWWDQPDTWETHFSALVAIQGW